jgi:DNA-binding response OmpR family regulator
MRVLIVDDDAELLLSCGVSLCHEGHEPTGTMDAGLALATATKEPVDVILLNTKLGGGAPAWLLSALRHDGVTPSVPLVLYSADPSTGEELLARQLGADAYLSTPREEATLSSAIEFVASFGPSERAQRRTAAITRLASAQRHPSSN